MCISGNLKSGHMHNPLALLREDLIDAMIQEGNTFYVRQTYLRGINHLDENMKGAFLFTHYKDRQRAQAHVDSLRHDQYVKLYDVNQPSDKEKLYTAARQPEGYQVFAAVLKDREWKPPPQLANHIKNYISSKTNWKPRGKQSLSASLLLEFGELFLSLKSGEGELKVPLKDIETGRPGAHISIQETKRISVYFHKNFSEQILSGQQALKIEDLEHVADIDAGGLENAFSLGQNTEGRLWIENPDVTIKGLYDPEIRSVSAGDVFRMDGSWYLISPNGFLKV